MADEDFIELGGRYVPLVQTGFRLVIQAAGDGFSDKTEIVEDDIIKLEPTIQEDDGGHKWERYGDDGDYIEIRQDLIWARSINPVMEPDYTQARPLTEDELAARSEFEPEDRNGGGG